MKIRFLYLFLVLNFLFFSCKKEENKFKVDIPEKKLNFEFHNVAQEFYNPKVSVEEFISKYPDFFKGIPKEEIQSFRSDDFENSIYQEINKTIEVEKLKTDLEKLFLRITYYYPKFKSPKVYLFSSVLQNYQEPVVYNPQKNTLLILVDCFLGEKNPIYQNAKIEQYFIELMNQKYIIPKVSLSIIETIVPFDATKREFLNHAVFNGKLMLLQDAFLPEYAEHQKMIMTENQYKWCEENEFYIWNYFLEHETLYSEEEKLIERFINFGPFSKFYLEIDGESPSGVGIFIGKKIVEKFYNEQNLTLQEVIFIPDYQKLFLDSKYQPKE